MNPSLTRVRTALEARADGHVPDLIVVERDDLLIVLQLAERADGAELIKDFHFSLAVGQASWRGTPLRLSREMFYALYTIVALREGATYRDIYDAMKGRPGHIGGRNGDFKTNVRSEIKRLRRRLREHGVPIACLKCRMGSGYYWDEKEIAHGL